MFLIVSRLVQIQRITNMLENHFMLFLLSKTRTLLFIFIDRSNIAVCVEKTSA